MYKVDEPKFSDGLSDGDKDFILGSYEMKDFADNLEAITEALEYENLLEYLNKRYPHGQMTLELFAEEAQVSIEKSMNIYRALNDAPPKDGRYFISVEDATTMILYLNYLKEK